MKGDTELAKKFKFDPDFSPEHQSNRDSATAKGLRYDRRKRAYVDADGCVVRDRFGQLL